MKKDSYLIIGIVILALSLYALTLRGAPGSPSALNVKENWDRPTQALELSPERGRYVHVVSMAETGDFALSREWAEVAFPDVGYAKDGRFFSFFAPGVAYIAYPFFLIGSSFGLGQVLTFSVESLVSTITLVFLFLIARNIFHLSRPAALFAVLVFGFASVSWSYAITLYQNAFTTCFLVTGFYAAWRFAERERRWDILYAAYVWLAYALAIFVDYPNAALFLPLMVYLAFATFSFQERDGGVAVKVRYAGIVGAIAFVVITGLHFAHNAHYYGGWSKLAGTLTSIHHYELEQQREGPLVPVIPKPLQLLTTHQVPADREILSTTSSTSSKKEKTVAGFFSEENIPRGIYVLLFSDERGLFYFSPIFLLALLGIVISLRNLREIRVPVAVMLSLALMNTFIYSAWGDPWGGWAFGARYLIPSMAILAIFVGVFVDRMGSAIIAKVVTYSLFLFSLGVSLLGALTSNAIPQKSEGILLPAGKYNFLLNYDFFTDGLSGSFLYNTYAAGSLSLMLYFAVIFGVVAVAALAALLLIRKRYE